MRKLKRMGYAALMGALVSCLDTTGPGADAFFAAPEASITASGNYSCALTSAGKPFCWGANDVAQLGTGNTTDVSVPTAMVVSDSFSMIDAGDPGGCALTRDGVAQCWGWSTSGTSAVSIVSPATFARVGAGAKFACGVTKTAVTYCWGSNQYGQLGNYSTTPATQATLVGGGLTFTSITVGLIHACALTPAGEAYCWGFNQYGALGNGTFVNSLGPTQVSGGIKFRSISAGGAYTCGVTFENVGYCWGINSSRQLGIDNTANAPVPTRVGGSVAFSTITAGSGNSVYMPTCGISITGDAYCWGYNDKGQLGSSTGMDCADNQSQPFACGVLPAKVALIANVAAIDPTVRHTCAMLTDRKTYCWGENTRGQLGDGTTTNSVIPIAVKAY